MIAAIVFVWWTGNIIHQQPDRTSLIAAIWNHVGYGMVLFVPLLLVCLLKFKNKANPQTHFSGWFSITNKLVDRIFWINVLSLMITGPLTVWARGSTLKIFNWFKIPSPVEKMPQVYEFLEKIHGTLANAWLVTFSLLFASLCLNLLMRKFGQE